MRKIFVLIIQGYRLLLSPFLGSNCRFYPSCSEYAQQAIMEHGVLRGLWLAIKRLGRCHPWHAGGIDPVPARKEKQ
jgi:putative membrane protein insertion efficiency factor